MPSVQYVPPPRAGVVVVATLYYETAAEAVRRLEWVGRYQLAVLLRIGISVVWASSLFEWVSEDGLRSVLLCGLRKK